MTSVITPARDDLLATARELRSLTASCMGPYGRSKFVQIGAHRSMVMVTSSGLRLFGENCSLPPRSIAARLLVDGIKLHGNSLGDGSLFTGNFACRLLAEALDPEAESGAKCPGLHVTREGFSLALEWSLEYLSDPTCPVRVAVQRHEYEVGLPEGCCTEIPEASLIDLALARAIISSKPVCRLRPDERERLAELVTRAARLSRHRMDDGRVASNVRVLPMLGKRSRESELIEGAILVENDVPPYPAVASNTSGIDIPPERPPTYDSEHVLGRGNGRECQDHRWADEKESLPPDMTRRRAPTHSGCSGPADAAGRCGGASTANTGPCPRSQPSKPTKPFPSPSRMEYSEGADRKQEHGASAPLNGHPADPLDPPSTTNTCQGPPIAGPTLVLLVECSLNMELRDPFDPEQESRGPRVEFLSELDGAAPSWTVRDREIEELEALRRTVVEAGVGLVACQRLIHPHLRRRLWEQGIVSLERLSATHISAFQSVTGAGLLGSWVGLGSIDRKYLGVVRRISVRRLHGRRFLEVAPADEAALESLGPRIDAAALKKRRKPVSTLVLCAPDRSALDELKVSVDGLLKVLLHTEHEGGVAFAGAGCWEVHLAAHLRHRAQSLREEPRGRTRPASMIAESPRSQRPPDPLPRQGGVPSPAANGRHFGGGGGGGGGWRASRGGRLRFDDLPSTPASAKFNAADARENGLGSPATSDPVKVLLDQPGRGSRSAVTDGGGSIAPGEILSSGSVATRRDRRMRPGQALAPTILARGHTDNEDDEHRGASCCWRPRRTIRDAWDQSLARVVDRFASCLEGTVCRRRAEALHTAANPWPCAAGMLPTELLAAVREANGLDREGGGRGIGGEERTRGAGLAAERVVPSLWGIGEDGETLQEIVRYGQDAQGKTLLLSAEVLDGYSSRLRAFESAVEACLCLMLAEGTIYDAS